MINIIVLIIILILGIGYGICIYDQWKEESRK